MYFTEVVMSILSYLIGSMPSAVFIARVFNLADPRMHGSGNPGATNMLRIGGRIPAVLTLVLDAIKGMMVVYGMTLYQSSWVGVAYVCVVLGHCYPLFGLYKGGKGGATAVGGLFALNLILGGAFVVLWLCVALITRYASLATLLAMLGATLLGFYLQLDSQVAILMVWLLVSWRHKVNIQSLLTGREKKIMG